MEEEETLRNALVDAYAMTGAGERGVCVCVCGGGGGYTDLVNLVNLRELADSASGARLDPENRSDL